jgi:hypothetical protein
MAGRQGGDFLRVSLRLTRTRQTEVWDVDPGTTIRAQSSVHRRVPTIPPSGIRAMLLAKSMSGQPPAALSS